MSGSIPENKKNLIQAGYKPEENQCGIPLSHLQATRAHHPLAPPPREGEFTPLVRRGQSVVVLED